jgi:hypothetical protein
MEKIITLHVMGTGNEPTIGIVYQSDMTPYQYNWTFNGTDAAKIVEYLDRIAYC